MALYKALVEVMLPGMTPADAEGRLKKSIPNWDFRMIDIGLADVQPPSLVGEGHIRLPLIGVKGGC